MYWGQTRTYTSGEKRSTVLTVSTSCRDFPLTDLGARFRVVFPPAHSPLRSPETNRRSSANDERLSVSDVSAIDSVWQGREFRCSMSYIGQSCAKRAHKFPKAVIGPSADPASRRQSLKSDGRGMREESLIAAWFSQSRKWLRNLATSGRRKQAIRKDVAKIVKEVAVFYLFFPSPSTGVLERTTLTNEHYAVTR